MKHSPVIYARAFAAVLSETPRGTNETLVKNFVASVRRHGDTVHWDKIIREVERLVRKLHGTRHIVIESARPLSSSQRKALRESFPSSDAVEEQISPDLIAGVKITIDGTEQLDGTLATKIERMFAPQ